MTDYTYPNISFNSKILGPTPASPLWRDGYAIVGDFNRGPNIPIKSNQLSVLTALFGDDKSNGSIALQQAMSQGASNATVVRVIPGTETAEMSFEIAGDNVNIVPRTGYESTVANTQVLDSFNRTTGFNLAIDYIGSAVLSNISFSRIATESGTVIHPTFKGRAQMNFTVSEVKGGSNLEPVVYEDAAEVLTVTLYNSGLNDYQVLSYTEGNNAYVEQYLEPGFTLKADGLAQPYGLTIVSAPFDLDENTNLKGVLVKGAFSPTASHVGNVNTVFSNKVLHVDELFFNDAAFAPTPEELVLMQDAAFLVNGQSFTATDVTETGVGTGIFAVTLTKSVSSVATVGMPVHIAPTVTSVSFDGTDTTVTLSGLLDDIVDASSSLTFSADLNKTYAVSSVAIPYASAAGTISVVIEGDVRPAAKLNSYVVVTDGSAAAISADVKVHFASKAQIIVGYNFRPVDSGASLSTVELGKTYFNLPNDQFDSYFVLQEGSGGAPLEFFYQVGPTTLNAATVLTQEPIGIKHVFGNVGDIKTYLVKDVSWAVPFVKDSVTVGGLVTSEDAYPVGTQASVILRDLENAIYTSSSLSSMFNEVKVDLTKTPYKVTGTPSFSGAESNRIFWNLTRYVGGPTAVFDTRADAVITVDDVPNVIALNPTDYYLFFNGQEYPIASVDNTANTITLDVANADFLDLATNSETLYFVSQAQTKDLLMRVDPTEASFSTATYGSNKDYLFIGGIDSAQHAYRDFYSLEGRPLLRVRALSPGLYGNGIKVTILPDEVTEDTAKFYLQVEDTDSSVSIGASKVETFYLSNTSVDLEFGLYLDTRESNLIRAYFIPAAEFTSTPGVNDLPKATYQSLPLRVAPPLEIVDPLYGSGFTRVNSQGASAVKDIALSGGVDFSDEDPPLAIKARISGYINALKQIESSDVNWVGVTGIYYGDPDYSEVFEYLKNLVDTSNPANGGFRRAVVQLVPSASPRQATNLRQVLNSPRFIQIAGVARGVTNNGTIYQQSSVVGSYVGLGASRAPHVSPASTYGGRVPVGLNYSSISNTPSVLDAYTRANTEVFFKDDTVGAYKFLNGLTTSNEPGLRYVSVVHVWDQVRDAIYKALIPYKSQPSTPQLWARISTACDAIMSQYMRDEWLMRYAPTICDERNNSEADLINGVVNILIQATPTFPADYIKVTDVLDLRANITLNAQPGRSITDF